MKKVCVYLISVVFFFQSSLFAFSSDPKEFVTELVTEAISKLSNKNLSKDEKAKFIEIIALENVDINALGLYTLGELRKSSDKQSVNNYQQAFEKYFLKSLTSRLTDYSSSKFVVVEAEQKSSNYTIIKSKIFRKYKKITPKNLDNITILSKFVRFKIQSMVYKST